MSANGPSLVDSLHEASEASCESIWGVELALPYDRDLEAQCAQRLHLASIALPVGADLLAPPRTVRLGQAGQ